MRRKSERVKDKDKTEKKSEKSPKKSRTRSTRRRKKSSSTSPESSEAEDIDSVPNSHDDTEEERSSGRSRREKPKVVYAEDDADVNKADTADEKGSNSRTRRSSKKQTAEETDEQVKVDIGADEAVGITEVKGESSDPKHKEKEGKSSLWQVKSADCSSGEIKKLKLCIVRPPEPELSPRKRKKLSRSSHRDQADGESEENTARDSSGERRKSRRSLLNASASDDSLSPDKHKGRGSSRGKHKSGDSSEDGQRTQDSSEEMAAHIVEVTVDKPDSPSVDEESATVAADVARDPFEDIQEVGGSPDGNSEVHEPRSPVAEESAESSNAPDSPEIPLQTIDPFDQLKAEGTKSFPKDTSNAVLEKLVESCDSTEPNLRAAKERVVESSSVAKEIPRVLDLIVEKSEICDSSVDLQKDLRIARNLSEKRLKERDIVQERPVPSKETIEDEVSSEELPKVRDSKKIPESQDLSNEIPKARDLSEGKPEVKDLSKRSDVSEASKTKPKTSDLSEKLPKESTLSGTQENIAEKTQVEEVSNIKQSPRGNTVESKHRSRRLIRSSAGDRNKHVSPPKTDVEVPALKTKGDAEVSSKGKYTKDVHAESKVETPSAKSNEDEDASTKKNKEEKVDVEDSKQRKETSRRARIVWDEKPTVESERHKTTSREQPAPSSISRELGRKRSPPKHQEVKEVAASIHLSNVKVSGAPEPTPPKRHEKITLKRSFSSKVASADSLGNGEKTESDQQQNHDKEDASILRKRRWGGNKTASAGSKPVLSISSDSLKNLVPEAKPLDMSEVELAPEEEKEEGEVEKDEEVITSDVDQEDEKVEEKEEVHEIQPVRAVKLVFPAGANTNVPLPDEVRDKGTATRKISIVTDEMRALQRSPSPARHRASDVLYITNLVRPFTVNQLKELLARTGTIADNGFWIDTIKSKCFVQYATAHEAKETRHALHGVRWPVSNPKQLCVDYGKQEDLVMAQANLEAGQIPRKTQPLKVDTWLSDLDREKERARLAREKERIERERVKDRDADRERSLKKAGSIREWDVGKMEGGAFEDGRQSREERGGEKERRMRKERNYRSPSPRDMPARKVKKREEDAPAKLLDDLFRKTKLTPCIYWLPLNAEQIVVKEEMRRKHMAEHERRLAEMRKAEKERMNRMQGRPPPRRYMDNKRRRHSLSGSPKK